jgi:ATP-dependent RNA helicase DBP3
VTFPLTVEDYIHRIGRTGRGGKSGKSITFFVGSPPPSRRAVLYPSTELIRWPPPRTHVRQTGENHETALAGEFMRVLRDAGAEIPKGMDRFPSTIKKREHGSYGAFFKDTSDAPAAKKIKFDF